MIFTITTRSVINKCSYLAIMQTFNYKVTIQNPLPSTKDNFVIFWNQQPVNTSEITQIIVIAFNNPESGEHFNCRSTHCK